MLKNLTEKEKGYLFGMFVGDGYKYYHKKSRHYYIEFYLNSIKDKKIINFIVKLLRKINLKPNLYQDKRYNCKRIRVYSKELFNLLHKDIKLKNETKELKIGFVSGIIDSEGYYNEKKSDITVVNTNKKVLDKCKEILEELKVNASINKRILSKKDKLPSYRMCISVKFKNRSHLSIKVPGHSYNSGVEQIH